MKQDECLQTLRQVVAEAFLLGVKLADKPYAGLFFDAANRPFWDGMRALHERTAAFLAASGLSAVSPDDVFPVQAEMQRIVESRS
jgi:hypothetical protein